MGGKTALTDSQRSAIAIKCLQLLPAKTSALVRAVRQFKASPKALSEILLGDDRFVLDEGRPESGTWTITERGKDYLHINGLEEKGVTEDTGEDQVFEGRFIFDDNKVLRDSPFIVCKIGEDELGFGLMLPKEVPIRAEKTKKIVDVGQEWSPAFITSKKRILEPTQKFESENRLKIDPIPNRLTLRWRLASIRKFLDGQAPRVSPRELFETVRGIYEKFMFFKTDAWYDIHALWDMGTYFFMLFNAYPILEMRGLSGTAKSKVMKISRLLSLNATELMVNPSEATLFRETHDKRPTKYIDEAEKLFKFNRMTKQTEADARAELINASYSRGAMVPRIEKDNEKFVTIYYNCYSPTMIGSIHGLYGATESRAITHIMTKAPDDDRRGEAEVETHEGDPMWAEARDGLYVFALQNWAKVEKAYHATIETDIKRRDLQLWKPIFVIAKLVGDDVFSRVRAYAERASAQRKEDQIAPDSFDFRLLLIMRGMVGQQRIHVRDIVNKYKEIYAEEDMGRGVFRRVCGRLDSIGFKEMRGRDNRGNFYETTKDDFMITVSPICPQIFTQSTQSTQIDNKQQTLKCSSSVDSVDIDKGVGVDSVDNVDNVDILEQALDRWKAVFGNNGPVHKDALTSRLGLTEDALTSLAGDGRVMETSPGKFKLI